MFIKNLEHLDALEPKITIKGGETTTGDGSLPPEIKDRILAKKNALRQESVSTVSYLSSFSNTFDGLGVRSRSSGGTNVRQRVRISSEPDITSINIEIDASVLV